MAGTQKITIEMPTALLDEAMAATGEGVTATVRAALRLIASPRAQLRLRELGGTLDIPYDLDRLREDR
jgi:hypothetical protein